MQYVAITPDQRPAFEAAGFKIIDHPLERVADARHYVVRHDCRPRVEPGVRALYRWLCDFTAPEEKWTLDDLVQLIQESGYANLRGNPCRDSTLYNYLYTLSSKGVLQRA